MESPANIEYTVKVSYMEIYMVSLFDGNLLFAEQG